MNIKEHQKIRKL